MKLKLCAAMLLSCIILSGCGGQTRTAYRSDSIEVYQKGAETTVHDLVTGKEYTYTTKRVNRSEAAKERRGAVDTDVVKVDILPGAGLEIWDKYKNTVLTLSR